MINLKVKPRIRSKRGNLDRHLQSVRRKVGLKVQNIDADLILVADPHPDTDLRKVIDMDPHSENLLEDVAILQIKKGAPLIARGAPHRGRKEAHHQGIGGEVHLLGSEGALQGKGGAHPHGNAEVHLQGDGIAPLLLLVGGGVHLLAKGEAFLQGQLYHPREDVQAHIQENGLDRLHLIHLIDGLEEDDEDPQVQVL